MSEDLGPDDDFDIERDIDPGVSDQYRKASAWPVFVAFGFVFSEVGVILGLFPVTVGGLLLFGGSVAAILRESGYITRPWRALLAFGGFFVLAGAAIAATQLDTVSVAAAVDPANAVAYRGAAVAVAGLILAVLGGTIRTAGADLA
jgi:hypothetical protein